MYVISLSTISIKTNFKQIARVELKCVQSSKGDYNLCMTSRYFFRSFTNVRLLCFFLTNETAQFLYLAVGDIKDLTPVRGQDGKISDTQGKDFWSPTRLRRVGDQ
jgi:hypothetical protein